MAQSPSFPDLGRHALWLRWLRISLVAGALYDLVFALLMVTAPDLPEKLLGLPQPGEAFYLWLMAVLLTMLAGFYLFAAYDPRAYSGNILIAIVGRGAGFLALGFAGLRDPALSGLLPLALADLLFAASHALFWSRVRR
ncbi:MAG: hypothetical protein AAF725_11105 [Acidobacteriota bacterium]